jgi:diguanylate cyclase (GGDEF)-like protein/PAS domain S-box-containing protein
MQLEILKQRAQAFDYLFDAVVVTDINGIITDWNKGSELLYGYTKNEALGQAVSILHVPEDTEIITAKVIAAVQADGKWCGEIRMLHKEGHIGWVESMCVPIFGRDQQMIGALGINRDISHRIEESNRIKRQAYYDYLTQVPNRYLLMERLTHIIEQAERQELSFCLLFIDINDFKRINDTYGHQMGDLVLKEFATRLKSTIRQSDTLARVGGDEFVVILEQTAEHNDIQTIINQLHALIAIPFTKDTITLNLSCSIGRAIYPQDGRSLDALLAQADKAMYRIKLAP